MIYEHDELQIYRGKDFVINEHIKIHQPSLGEICDWGEQRYFSFIRNITATPTDLKYTLSLSEIDWNDISDYELFLMRHKTFTKEYSEIILGDFDISSLKAMVCDANGDIVLCDEGGRTMIDRSIYELMANHLRKSHNLTKNTEKAMNETTKQALLAEAKEEYETNQNKEYHSDLLPLISTLVNMEGFKYGWADIWNMKINAFMDAVRQIQHVKNVDLLLSSGYSGFGIDLKKISKKELNYFTRPNEN